MTSDEIRFLFEYHLRTNDRILATAAELSPDQLRQAASLDHGSVLQTLRHMVDVDWSWLKACRSGEMDQTYLWQVVPLDDLAGINEFLRSWRVAELAHIDTLDEAGLAKMLRWGDKPGQVSPIWQVYCHVVNHGTQHRSELARYFTELGHSPGDLDIL